MKIRLDWKSLFPSSHGQFSICQDSDERVECLKGQYAEIFKPELGTVKGVPAKLHLKENATPVFQRLPDTLCPAPYRGGRTKAIEKRRSS